MTIQPTEAPTISLDLLVGEMPEVPCESSTHGIIHNGGKASHYASVTCPGCDLNTVKAYCLSMVELVLRNVVIECSSCQDRHCALGAIRILGPVNA